MSRAAVAERAHCGLYVLYDRRAFAPPLPRHQGDVRLSGLERAAARMRRDWDARAADERNVYSRDSAADVADFDASGQANYDQLVRPYLPVLLEGRPARACRALEIGCGPGRMTRPFAAEFGEVWALDVSPAMLETARERLAGRPNVRLHLGSGYDLAGIGDARFDLVFSYIVFQHIPVREAIETYVREAARVLKPGGVFKFQLQGDQSPACRAREPDTWLGVTFSEEEARAMLDVAGLSPLMAEGAGGQYFVLTARKGPPEAAAGPRPHVFPGEAWAAAQLKEGWGEPVGASWRPVSPESRAVLGWPGGPARFFLGLYFWPDDPAPAHEIEIALDGVLAGKAAMAGPGDHYVELPAPQAPGGAVEVRMTVRPPCEPGLEPAVRCLGLYRPA
jgi:SAM-dependent methyltransferase